MNVGDYLVERGWIASVSPKRKTDEEGETFTIWPRATTFTDEWGDELGANDALERARMNRIIIYDVETANAIQGRNEERIDGIEYCEGWDDHAGMGIGVLCGWSYTKNAPFVIMKDNFETFRNVVSAKDALLVGVNNHRFDDNILRSNGCDVGVTYDILREMWIALGLDPDNFVPATHGKMGLEDMAVANLGGAATKSGSGKMAPIDFQRGNYGKVISYCLGDVMLTKGLFDRILQKGELINPRTGLPVPMRNPLSLLDSGSFLA